MYKCLNEIRFACGIIAYNGERDICRLNFNRSLYQVFVTIDIDFLELHGAFLNLAALCHRLFNYGLGQLGLDRLGVVQASF